MVAKEFQNEIENFKNVINVLSSLQDPSMTDEAWEEIRELFKESIQEDDEDQTPYFHDIKDERYTVNWIL